MLLPQCSLLNQARPFQCRQLLYLHCPSPIQHILMPCQLLPLLPLMPCSLDWMLTPLHSTLHLMTNLQPLTLPTMLQTRRLTPMSLLHLQHPLRWIECLMQHFWRYCSHYLQLWMLYQIFYQRPWMPCSLRQMQSSSHRQPFQTMFFPTSQIQIHLPVNIVHGKQHSHAQASLQPNSQPTQACLSCQVSLESLCHLMSMTYPST